MTSRNKIYVFCPGGLQSQTDVDKLSFIYNPAKSILTNLIILTKGTAQRTAGKKDSSASAENRYKWFFSKVQSREGNAKAATTTRALLRSRINGMPCITTAVW